MKENENRNLMRTAGLGSIMLLFMATGAAQAQDKHLDLVVQQTPGGTYKLVFANSECPNRPNDGGCVYVGRGRNPNISWELDARSRGEWRLTSLQFSPDGTNWGEPGVPLQDCTMTDFRLAPGDRDSGFASSARIHPQGFTLTIWDSNEVPCVTYYKITAANSAGDEIDSDPIIDNRGGN